MVGTVGDHIRLLVVGTVGDLRSFREIESEKGRERERGRREKGQDYFFVFQSVVTGLLLRYVNSFS